MFAVICGTRPSSRKNHSPGFASAAALSSSIVLMPEDAFVDDDVAGKSAEAIRPP
jgi:hypothetical protein